jgi:hypothetical protein
LEKKVQGIRCQVSGVKSAPLATKQELVNISYRSDCVTIQVVPYSWQNHCIVTIQGVPHICSFGALKHTYAIREDLNGQRWGAPE